MPGGLEEIISGNRNRSVRCPGNAPRFRDFFSTPAWLPYYKMPGELLNAGGLKKHGGLKKSREARFKPRGVNFIISDCKIYFFLLRSTTSSTITAARSITATTPSTTKMITNKLMSPLSPAAEPPLWTTLTTFRLSKTLS